jgi:hypothetical protein
MYQVDSILITLARHHLSTGESVIEMVSQRREELTRLQELDILVPAHQQLQLKHVAALAREKAARRELFGAKVDQSILRAGNVRQERTIETMRVVMFSKPSLQ